MRPDWEAEAAPDDTGARTFQRFRYQAHVTFRYCLDCALLGNVSMVVPEHFEDLAVEYLEGSLRLIQIKTRDPGRRPWRLTDLLGDGGALRSLCRSYQALREVSGKRDILFEARLEGSLARNDLLGELANRENRGDELVRRCMGPLDLNEGDCRRFLDHVLVMPGEPDRALIADRNVSLLGRAAPHLRVADINELYERVIARIETAMEGQLLRDAWPRALVEPESQTEEIRRVLDGKTLTRDLLMPMFALLRETPQPLLRRVVDPDAPPPTLLEEKMLAAGAPQNIVGHAKTLRANALRREYELRAADLMGRAERLEDLQVRLQILADGIAASQHDAELPAIPIWNQLMRDLAQQREVIDPNHLFARDPMLLLGKLCIMSEECLFLWRAVANA